MTRAMEPVDRCEILRNNPRLDFREGEYRYTITREGQESLYSVTDGKTTVTLPLAWALGLGEAGQTYVYRKDGKYFESRVSFFKARNGLDLTMGAQNYKPANVSEAAGRPLSTTETRECFSCHSTGPVHSLTPGVQCVRCHEGGDTHAVAAQRGDRNATKIARLGKLSTEETSNFCGQCHHTWADIAANGPHSINNVRFQPYRLANSKCYDAADSRIGCTACHDPHQTVATAPAAYDAKCQSCHATSKTCPVAKQNCTTCHMPKFELPGAHHKFTDHQIRVVRANDPYPN